MVERRTGQPDAMGAREMLAALLDRETFSSWDTPPAEAKQDPAYAAELAAARDKTGLDESVITGSGRIRGRQVAVATSEFGFLGGSIGVAAGQRLVAAIDRAAAQTYGAKTDGSAAAANAQVLAELAELIAKGRLEIPIAKTYPLAKVREAFHELEQHHTLGKIVLEP